MDKHLDAEALSDYAEGAAEAPARAAAAAHLEGCAQCRRELTAIQAYFRELADLEPARAPADFLSRVRARLPRPSPWERAWAALLIPFRFIPVPIAVGVIIGVTAITVYMRQGGPENRTLIPVSSSMPADGSAAPAAEGNSAKSSPPTGKDEGSVDRLQDGSGTAAVGPVPPVLSTAPAKPRKSFSLKPQEVREGSAAPKPPSPASASSSPTAPSPMVPSPVAALGKRDTRDTRETPAQRNSPAKGAPTQPTADDASRKLSEVEMRGGLDEPSAVYILNNSAPAELPLDKSMPVEEKSAVPGQAEAAAGQAAEKRKEDEADKKEERGQEARGGLQPAPGRQMAPPPVPASGYALSLRARSDTAAVLAGLRSMGVLAESEYASASERRFRLIVPAPMLRELGPYLARHGVSRPEGQLPSAASNSVLSIRLRLIFPAR